MNKTILITGATSGIGKATAEKFAQNNYNLIITGRRKERLLELENQLKKFPINIFSLEFDVRKPEQVKSAIESLPPHFRAIDILVNNAGLAAGLGTMDEGVIENWENMIDTNIKGLLYVSKHVMPLMIEKGKGHIINIGSIAGKEVYLKGNVYCATKHAVDAISKSMRIDLLPHKIKVTNVNPGAVETEFSIVRLNGDKEKAAKVYEGFQPLLPMDIAEIIYFVASQPAHVNINDIVVTPTAQANTVHILKDL
ncbi:MAG: SDR family NAD(P)-dependent oxidoreductase [Bacteroidetes bacterium]|nr:SDR family NAD(P)-dependent oxidoreductase [Bacteroidota bacterium]HET6244164.1 SDR family NAD(P)-dependent oxidoreductase [Bacteroidia bacterium]